MAESRQDGPMGRVLASEFWREWVSAVRGGDSGNSVCCAFFPGQLPAAAMGNAVSGPWVPFLRRL